MTEVGNNSIVERDFGAPVLAVCGYSGSGKTTLLEAAIPQLIERGLSVAVVKHDAHGFTVDQKGKDSDRLFRAGATVALRGPKEQFLRRGARSALTLEATLAELARDHDIVLVEGHKDTPLAKLWLSSAEIGPPPEQVTEVRDLLPWNGDRLKQFLDYVDRWLPQAWLRRPQFAGLLMGGESQRMGTPKQMMRFGNSTLGEIAGHALGDALQRSTRLRPKNGNQHPDLLLLGAGPIPDSLLQQPRLLDPPGVAGPVAGLLSAHRWAPTAAWVVSACDHPWLSLQEIETLIRERRAGRWAIISRQLDGHPCPTLAIYEPQALELLERSYWTRREDTRLALLLEDSHTWISPHRMRGSESVNTRQEFQAAQDQAKQESQSNQGK
jgi:molybdopterin-guanine dinucleotide biosynthesis protein MobB